MSELNFTRERAEAYSNINNLSPSKLFSQDWLAMYDLLSTLSENTGMTNEPWQEWRDKIRALIGGE